MADKPVVHLSLAKVRKDLVKPEVFQVALSGSKIITFPDLYDMESVEAEETFGALNRNMTSWDAIGKWLSAKDVAALKAEKLSIRELSAVIQAAVTHYETSYGDAGKGNA